MAQFQQLKARATKDLTAAFDSSVSVAFLAYLKEEEFESFDEVVEEINTKMEQCYLLEALSDKFQWSNEQKAHCFKVLRIICHLEQGVIRVTSATSSHVSTKREECAVSANQVHCKSGV